MDFSLRGLASTAAGAVMLAAAGAVAPVHADTLIATIDGNDCPGVFGSPFSSCVARFPLTGSATVLAPSPVIIKVGFHEDGTIATTEINTSLFPSIDGSEFSFTFGASGTGTGTWRYTPGDNDPLITAFVAKAGPRFSLFANDGDEKSGSWSTPEGRALSHLTLYGSWSPLQHDVPEPASLALFGAGLFGLGLAAHRRRRG